jgi:hypothetical protein
VICTRPFQEQLSLVSEGICPNCELKLEPAGTPDHYLKPREVLYGVFGAGDRGPLVDFGLCPSCGDRWRTIPDLFGHGPGIEHRGNHHKLEALWITRFR